MKPKEAHYKAATLEAQTAGPLLLWEVSSYCVQLRRRQDTSLMGYGFTFIGI